MVVAFVPSVAVAEDTNPSNKESVVGNSDQEPAKQQIESWIQQLNDQSYAARQSASKSLIKSGISGIPILHSAARGKNPEVTARIVDLLGKLYASRDPAISSAAGEALEDLMSNGPPIAAVRTEQLMGLELAPIRRRQAITMIRHYGGHLIPRADFNDDGETIEADLNQESTLNHVVLGKKWTGGLLGIKYLQRLNDLRVLYVTREIPLNADELDKLRQSLPGVRVEIRGSAFLGVSAEIPDPEICVINKVSKNSPAERGGLKGGDIITHVDGLPIRGFLGLTEQLMTRKGGDHVLLEIVRDDEFLELEVVLGEW